MRRFRLRPRTWIALGVVGVVAAAMSVAGYAYFTSSGSGSGAGWVGTAGPVTITPAWPGGQYLYPGNTVDVPLTITNTSTTASVYVSSVGGGATSTPAGCDNDWFVVTGTVTPVVLGPGESTGATGHVAMIESYTPQDACQGSNPVIGWTSG